MRVRVLSFDCHLPNLFRELIEGHPSPGPLRTSVNLTLPIIAQVAERAAELDDPRLNVLMLRLALYDFDPQDRLKLIEQQEARIQKGGVMGNRLVERLEELSRLGDGWKDGEGWGPTAEAVEAARPFAVSFSDDGPSLFPTLYGGLLFEGPGFKIRIRAEGDVAAETTPDTPESRRPNTCPMCDGVKPDDGREICGQCEQDCWGDRETSNA